MVKKPYGVQLAEIANQNKAADAVYKSFEIHCDQEHIEGLDRIREAASIAYSALYPKYRDKGLGKLDEPTLTHLTNAAVTFHLAAWLENDKHSTQTIRSFVNYPYTPHSEIHTKGDIPPEHYEVSNYNRAEAFFKNLMRLRDEQAADEGVSATSWVEYTPTGKRKYYTFPSLRFMELFVDDKLLLLEHLALRKAVMGDLAKIKDGYVQYDHLFEESRLSELQGQSMRINQMRKYVASCIQIQKLESAYRFHLAAKLSSHMVNHKLSFDDVNMEAAEYCLGRYYCATPLRNQAKNIPIGILSYDKVVEALFGDGSAAKELARQREFVTALIDLMNLLLLPKVHSAPWKDDDFLSAAEFFKKEYPVIESYESVFAGKSEEEKSECCKIIQEFFQTMEVNADRPYGKILQDRRKQQNKKSRGGKA